jgi:hypothetical protein
VAIYAIRGALRPLNDLIAQEKYDMSQCIAATVDEGKGMDGKQHALPVGTWRDDGVAARGAAPCRHSSRSAQQWQ